MMTKPISFFLILTFLCLSWHSPIAAKRNQRLWEYKKNHYNVYSLSDEIKIGEHYLKEQIKAFKKRKLAVNPKEYEPLRKRIQKIVKRLARVSDIPNLPYEVVIFDKKDVANAYCLPGGKIGIFTGIFDKEKGLIDPKSDDEIAAVLGHEMAHATMRHVTRRMTTYRSIGLIGGLVSIGVGRAAGGSWAQLSQQVFNTGSLLYFPSYSRRYEKEADQVGFYYMAKAGFDPKAAIKLWERAAVKSKKKGRDKTSFFASHPHSGARAKKLKGYLADIEYVKKQQRLMKKMKCEKC
jgi:metalloendopeptidase OMA1, mitochondrial